MSSSQGRLILALAAKWTAASHFEQMFDGTVKGMTENLKIQKEDVVFFDGGTDISSSLYREDKNPFTQSPEKARDLWERQLFIKAQAAGAACIGICRGAQLLCALSGGRLIQHVTGHHGSHKVVTFQKEVIEVTSTHHQMMWPGFADHELLAWAIHYSESYCEYGKSFDMTHQPEIVWFPQTRSLAIQGHPEYVKMNDRFPQFCRELVTQFIFKEKI